MCVSTVRVEMTRFSAISVLVRPRAASSTISALDRQGFGTLALWLHLAAAACRATRTVLTSFSGERRGRVSGCLGCVAVGAQLGEQLACPQRRLCVTPRPRLDMGC